MWCNGKLTDLNLTHAFAALDLSFIFFFLQGKGEELQCSSVVKKVQFTLVMICDLKNDIAFL